MRLVSPSVWSAGLPGVLALSVLAVVGSVALSGDGKGNTAQVLFLPKRAVLIAGDLDLMCKADQAELTVDGQRRQWEPFQSPLHVAYLDLEPGVHELEVAGQKLELFVAVGNMYGRGPKGWPVYRRHPIEGEGAERCAKCHRVKQQGGQAVVGDIKSHRACFECHQPVDFELTHAHPLEPIDACQMCHSPHGSSREALLRAPPKQLCAECHES